MITSAGINLIENFIRSIIAHAEVRVGSTWYKAADTDVSISSGEDKVMVLATIPKAVAAGATISEVRLISTNGQVFSSKSVTITRSSKSTGVMYCCEIFIAAGEVVGS